MRYILIAMSLIVAMHSFAFTKVIKESAFAKETVKGLIANTVYGNFVIRKSNTDSVRVRVTYDGKDFQSYHDFTMKNPILIQLENGQVQLRVGKYSHGPQMLTYELELPSDIYTEINSEKSDISVKDTKINLKAQVLAGKLWAYDVEGILFVSTEKMALDVKATKLQAQITAKQSLVVLNASTGKVNVMNSNGDTYIYMNELVETDVQSINGDVNLLLPKTVDGLLQIQSAKRPIHLNVDQLTLFGAINPNQIKVNINKGGTLFNLVTTAGQVYVSNVSLVVK